MDSNTYSTRAPEPPAPLEPLEPPPGPPTPPGGLGFLPAAVGELAAEDLNQLPDTALAEEVLELRRWMDQLEGQWLRRLAAVDARGAAGADQAEQAPSTAGWLRSRLRMGASTAHDSVRTARALFRGPLTGTAQALLGGAISPAHARVLAHGTRHLPDHLTRQADPVLVETARRLDPPRLRQAVGYLLQVADPDGADAARERRHERRGLWLSPTFDGMVAVDGLLEAEAGQTVLAALEPLARPAAADDTRGGGQRTADALTELARRALEAGRLPRSGGVRPQLLVTVDLDSLLGHPGDSGGLVGGPGGLGGDLGGVGPLAPDACRRLACDGALTRVVVSRHPDHQQPSHHLQGSHSGHGHDPTDHQHRSSDDGLAVDRGANPDHDPGAADPDPSEPARLQDRLRAAMALLPPALGGAPSQPLEVGRSTRVIHPAQRHALAVRDGGCVFPGCDRPLAWCDAHHLWHWVDGGPTDLGNLAMVCRTHHRAVHEGRWQLTRGPDGRFTATPGHRQHRPAA